MKLINKKIHELNINIETFRNNIRNLYTYIPYFQKYIRISDLENCLEISQESNSNGLIVLDAQKHSQGIPSSTGLNSIENAQDKLLSLLNNYDKIVNLIENAQEHPQSISNNSNSIMDLNMPNNNKLKKTTIRVNEDIWNQFKECIETEFNHLEQYDMISVALRDFVNKYSVLNK